MTKKKKVKCKHKVVKEEVDLFFDTSQPAKFSAEKNHDANRALVGAIFEQSSSDFVSVNPDCKPETAKRFLKKENPLFKYYCYLLDMDPDYVEKKMYIRIKDFYKKKAKKFIKVNKIANDKSHFVSIRKSNLYSKNRVWSNPNKLCHHKNEFYCESCLEEFPKKSLKAEKGARACQV